MISDNLKSKKICEDVTCIMSVYKNDRKVWVREAILSILNSDVLPGEFVVYCDGAVDSSVDAMLKAFCRDYSEIFSLYGSDSNRGRAYSRQFMIEKAKGKYILLMDADDISVPNRLKIQYDHALRNPELDLIGGYITEFSDGFEDRLRKVPLLDVDVKKMMKYAQPINHVTLLAKRDCILGVGGYLEAGNCEDFYLIARCVVSGAIIENIPEVLVRVRVDENFVNRRRGWRIALDELRVIKFMWMSKYINVIEYMIFGAYRIIIRSLPSWIVLKLYAASRTSVKLGL